MHVFRSLKYYLLFALFIILFMLVLILQRPNKKNIAYFVQQLQPGWNLGNTLDSHGLANPASIKDVETYWGNPYTTREMIHSIKEKGFHTVRIPVTWEEHMNTSMEVDSAWMNRVQEIVDYCLDEDLYVIINAHHDSWYQPDKSHYTDATKRLTALWSQIAEHFRYYDEHLLFESMNEPRLIHTKNEWTAGTKEAQIIVNKYNHTFVDAIRSSTSPNNKTRYLLIPTYGASTDLPAMESLELPDDDHLIVSLHLYDPYDFALNPVGTDQWDPKQISDTQEIDTIFQNINNTYTKKAIHVLLTEFGAIDKSNEADRAVWTKYVLDHAQKQNITCIWWDDSLFDRSALTWHYPSITAQLCP